jgi:hypothetical protein
VDTKASKGGAERSGYNIATILQIFLNVVLEKWSFIKTIQ